MSFAIKVYTDEGAYLENYFWLDRIVSYDEWPPMHYLPETSTGGYFNIYPVSATESGKFFNLYDYWQQEITADDPRWLRAYNSPDHRLSVPIFRIPIDHTRLVPGGDPVIVRTYLGLRASFYWAGGSTTRTLTLYASWYEDAMLLEKVYNGAHEMQFANNIYPADDTGIYRPQSCRLGVNLINNPLIPSLPDMDDVPINARFIVQFLVQFNSIAVPDPNNFVTFGDHDNRSSTGFLLRGYRYPGWGSQWFNEWDKHDLYSIWHDNLGEIPEGEWSSTFDPEYGESSEPQPYEPGFDGSSDTIELPASPTIGVSDIGFLNVYRIPSGGLQQIGIELFPPLAYTPPTPISAGSSVMDTLADAFNQLITFLANVPSFVEQMSANTLINYIVDCHVVPFTPPASTSPVPIEVGSKTLRAQAPRVTQDYHDVDCGTISLAEYYGNFADFLENCKLYLPFVGFVPVRPEWFKRTSLNVYYRFNVIDGSFVAFVRSSGKYVNGNNAGTTIVAQYSGVACTHLPITGVTYSSMVSGLIGAGSGIVAGAASGNLLGVAGSAVNAATARGDIAQSNAYSASAALMGCRRPFLLIERPVSNFSATYKRELGIPSNVSVKLGTVSGFATVGNVHLDGIDATEEEKRELEAILHSGVIF